MPIGDGLFNNYKQCNFCGRPLPLNYEEDTCPTCKEYQLFHEVKEYIRENDVNEYMVSKHFHIPLRQVKEWIREGRIEYRQSTTEQLKNVHCQICGAPVSFGTMCPKCLKKEHSRRGYMVNKKNNDDGRIHYIDK